MILALVLPLALVACAQHAGNPCPMPTGPPTSWQNNPVDIGTAVPSVVIYMTPRPGDRIELLGAEALDDLRGADIRFLLSRAVIKPDGTHLIGEEMEPLEGAMVTTGPDVADPTVGIVAEITPREAGAFGLTGVRLRYRLNGGPEQVGEGIEVIFTVCANHPAPRSCETEPTPR